MESVNIRNAEGHPHTAEMAVPEEQIRKADDSAKEVLAQKRKRAIPNKKASAKSSREKPLTSKEIQDPKSTVNLDGIIGEYSEVAGEIAFLELLSMNLLAEMLAAMPRSKVAKLKELMKEIRNGKIRPKVVVSNGERKGTKLPEGVKGAFVAGAQGGQGTIVLSPGLTEKERRAVLAEELGEAIAHRATQLGLKLAPGDAGARAAAMLNGAKLSPERDPEAFQTDELDGGLIRLDGEEVQAKFAGPRKPKRSTGIVAGSPGSAIAGPRKPRGKPEKMYAQVKIAPGEAIVVEMRDPVTGEWKQLATSALGTKKPSVHYIEVPVIRQANGKIAEPELRVRNLSRGGAIIVSEDRRRVKKNQIQDRYLNYSFDTNKYISPNGRAAEHSPEVSVIFSKRPTEGEKVTRVEEKRVPNSYSLTIDVQRLNKKEGWDHFEVYIDGKWKRLASRSSKPPYGFVPDPLPSVKFNGKNGRFPRMRFINSFKGVKEIQLSPIDPKVSQKGGRIQMSAETSSHPSQPGAKVFRAEVIWDPRYHLPFSGRGRINYTPVGPVREGQFLAVVSVVSRPETVKVRRTESNPRIYKPFRSLSKSRVPDVLGVKDFKSSGYEMTPTVAERVLSYIRGGVSQKDFKLAGNGDRYIRRNKDGVTWSFKKNALSPIQRAAIVVGVLRDTSLPGPLRRAVLKGLGISQKDLEQLARKFPKVGGGIDTSLLMGAYRFKGANFFVAGKGKSFLALNRGAIEAARAVKPLLNFDPAMIKQLGLGPKFLDMIKKARNGARGGFNHLLEAINKIVAAIGKKTAKFAEAMYARYADLLRPGNPQHKKFMKDMKVIKTYAARFKGDRKLAAKQIQMDVRSGKVKFSSKVLKTFKNNAYKGYDLFLGFILGFDVPGVKSAVDAIKKIGNYMRSAGAPDSRVYQAAGALDGLFTPKLDVSLRCFITIPQENYKAEGLNYSLQVRVGRTRGVGVPATPRFGSATDNPDDIRLGGASVGVEDGFEVHIEMNARDYRPKEIKFVFEVEGVVAGKALSKEFFGRVDVGQSAAAIVNGRVAFSWLRNSEGKMDIVPDIFNVQGVVIGGVNEFDGAFFAGGGTTAQAARDAAARLADRPVRGYPTVGLIGFVGVAGYAGVDFAMTQDGHEKNAVRGVSEARSNPTEPRSTPRPSRPEPHLFGQLDDNMPAPGR